MIPRDEIRIEYIEEYVYGQGKEGKELQEEIENYTRIIRDLPAFMFAKNTDNPMEKSKFLLPNP